MQVGGVRHQLVELIDGHFGRIRDVEAAQIVHDLGSHIVSNRRECLRAGLTVAVLQVGRVSVDILGRPAAQIRLEDEIVIAVGAKRGSCNGRRAESCHVGVITAERGRIERRNLGVVAAKRRHIEWRNVCRDRRIGNDSAAFAVGSKAERPIEPGKCEVGGFATIGYRQCTREGAERFREVT